MTVRELALFLGVLATPSGASETENWLQRSEMKVHQQLVDLIGPLELRSPTAFTTDGCSGGMSWSWERLSALVPDLREPDGQRPPWEICCVAHDRAYHDVSGAETAKQSFDARLAADKSLRACVSAVGEDLDAKADDWGMTMALYARLAESMFWAVRFGGAPCTGLPWRWGYGFEQC